MYCDHFGDLPGLRSIDNDAWISYARFHANLREATSALGKTAPETQCEMALLGELLANHYLLALIHPGRLDYWGRFHAATYELFTVAVNALGRDEAGSSAARKTLQELARAITSDSSAAMLDRAQHRTIARGIGKLASRLVAGASPAGT
jgi:hypothetical protein